MSEDVRKSPNDHPFYEVAAEAARHVANGATVFQKWTCAGCGARLTLEEPNKFHLTGTCDLCPAVTNIEAQGCNYLLIKSSVRPHADV